MYYSVIDCLCLDFSATQTFGSTDKEEPLRGASDHAVYFVILAIGVGFVQFAAVSLWQ